MRADFITSLIELLNRIEVNRPRNVGESQEESERIYVDASQDRWGLAWWAAGNLHYRSGKFPGWLTDKPIAYKELYAAEMGLVESVKRNLTNVTIISDNKNVVSWMSRWCAGPPIIMSWLQRLLTVYYVKGTFKGITWTSSHTNLADAPSRLGGSVMNGSITNSEKRLALYFSHSYAWITVTVAVNRRTTNMVIHNIL